MLPLVHTISDWAAPAAASLVAATWQGLMLTCGIAICLRLWPGLGAAWRSLLWMAVFLLVVMLHFSSLDAHGAGLPGSQHPGALRLSPSWCFMIACGWGVLSLYRATRLAWSVARLRTISRRARPVDCDSTCAALLRSSRRPVALYTSVDLDRPSVIGFRSPRILIPQTLLAVLSQAELEQVLLHELEHLRRADDWTNLLQKLVLILFPLNPVLLWIEYRLCAERELACDDGVLRATHARKAYAECLTRLAEHSIHSFVRRGAALALGAWERQTELSRRVYRVLRQPDRVLAARQSGMVTSFLALALLAGAGALTQTPQLVRFAPDPLAAISARTGEGLSATRASLAARPSEGGVRLIRASLPVARVQNEPAIGSMSRTHALHPSRSNRFHRDKTRTPSRALAVRLPASGQTMATPDWLVLTGWGQSTQAGSFRLAVQTDIWPTYAAVPVANGWLIFQL